MSCYEICTLRFELGDPADENRFGVKYTLIDPSGKCYVQYERRPTRSGMPPEIAEPSDILDDYRWDVSSIADLEEYIRARDAEAHEASKRRDAARVSYEAALASWWDHPVEVWFGVRESDMQPFDNGVIETVLFNTLSRDGWRNIASHYLYDEYEGNVIVVLSEFRFERSVETFSSQDGHRDHSPAIYYSSLAIVKIHAFELGH
jgi:hypothetical protein